MSNNEAFLSHEEEKEKLEDHDQRVGTADTQKIIPQKNNLKRLSGSASVPALFQTKYSKNNERGFRSPTDKIGLNYSLSTKDLTMSKLSNRGFQKSSLTSTKREVKRKTNKVEVNYSVQLSPKTKATKRRRYKKADFLSWEPVAEDSTDTLDVGANNLSPHRYNHNQNEDEDKQDVVAIVQENEKNFREYIRNTKPLDVSGRTCQMAPHKSNWEESILGRLSETNLLTITQRQEAISSMIDETRKDYFNSIKTSIATYNLKSPRNQKRNQVNPHLISEPRLSWIDDQYKSKDWRVLRKTGLSHEGIVSSKQSLEQKLQLDKFLIELQYLWLDGKYGIDDFKGECNFVDVGTLNFRKMLPLETASFVKHVQSVADTVRSSLQKHWLADASETVSRCLERILEPKNEEQGNSNVELILVAASTLMSRQVRNSIESSIQRFLSFFERYKNTDNPPDCPVFMVKLEMVKENDTFVPCIVPSFEELENKVLETLDYVVNSSTRLPRVDGNRFLGPCEMELDNETLLKAKQNVKEIIECQREQCEALLKGFRRYLTLYTGEEEKRIKKVIKSRQLGPETRDSLKELNNDLKRLRQVQEDIRGLVNSREFFPMFTVDCEPLQNAMCKQAESYIEMVQLQISKDNTELMSSLCDEYADIMTKLMIEPQDSEELRKLITYAKSTEARTKEMETQIVTEVSPRINFALNFEYYPSDEDVALVCRLFDFPEKVWETQRRSEKLQESQKEMRIKILERRRELFADELSGYEEDLKKLTTMGNRNPDGVERTLKRVNELRANLEKAENEIDGIRDQEELLEQELTAPMWMTRYQTLKKGLDPFGILWDGASQHLEQTSSWLSEPLVSLDAEAIDQEADNTRRAMTKLVKEFERNEYDMPKEAASSILAEAKTFLDDYCPLMLLLCNPGLKERHWEDMSKETNLSLPYSPDINLEQVVQVGLHKHVQNIEEICVSASKEYSLEKAMDKMEDEWAGLEFLCKSYKETGTYIVGGIDEIQTLLDDHIVKAQAMRSSRYILPLIDRITEWEGTLVALQDIIDNWLKLQGVWLYLEPIFGSPDIIKQMPTEAKLFQQVDAIWRESMEKTANQPGVITTARRPGLLDSLIKANEKMDVIQKGLNDYLETKRLFFPRFFFLSNDELLEILSETKDPLRVNPFLKKAFEGINELEFTPDLDIVAMMSPQKEKIPFDYPAIDHEVINPNKTGGNVEVWLVQTETVMRRSCALTQDQCMKAYAQCEKRTDWVQEWQGQMLICTSQTYWTMEVEKALTEKGNQGMHDYYKVLQKQLADIVQLVRGNLSKLLRTAIGAMVTLDVHSRDTVDMLAKSGASTAIDFDWISQLRYYWYDDGISAKTGKPASVDVKMITACRAYDFEYLGCSGRLVVTPLTDRCYRTLMGAIQLLYGGAPEGPAGTGKTETTKDLGKAVAVQTVVFNCSDGLDYLAMGKFFKGLLASGAWACFDEFNRIELEVLSVIAQQILTITRGKQLGLEILEFEGTTLPLKVGCSVYITMNPGYAGRSDLPDNLKALFRPCAMMVPDYGMIGEIILYSFGYLNAKVLAQKIVATYRLCSEQLSSQKHYDYGMRAVMSVLRAAGSQKRLPENRDTDEAILMLRSIIDVNEPKFLAQDMPLFGGIVGDLFPGIKLPDPDRTIFRDAFLEVCKEMFLQPTEFFYFKVIQVYEMLLVRHGFMVVGLPFGGKSSAWKCLARMMTILHEQYPDDPRWVAVVAVVINPKSISMGMLYGQFDEVTHEWTDGVLAIKYRDCANSKIGKVEDRKWVLFDGPVDAIWIENMNTVLDDNKKLCLQSGEMIGLSDEMSMMFEPMDLEVASPATVSRCGVIFFEPHLLRWKPMLDSWLDIVTTEETEIEIAYEKLKESEQPGVDDPFKPAFYILKEQRKLIEALFAWLMDPCCIYIDKCVKQEAPCMNTNMVVSCLNIFESLLQDMINKADGTPRLATTAEIECLFVFSLIWSVGATVDVNGRAKFNEYLRNIMEGNTAKYIEDNYDSVWTGLTLVKWKIPSFKFDGEDDDEEEEEERDPDDNVYEFTIPLPEKGEVYDYCYSEEKSKWVSWLDIIDTTPIPQTAEYSAIVVPTINTTQFSYLMELLFLHSKPTLTVGPTGTGKSTYVQDVLLNTLPKETYMTIMTGFSAQTSAAQLQEIIDGRMDRRRKGVFGPAVGKKYILFVDDLNMPEVEEYGAQPPIELLRQLVDNGGWYDQVEKNFRTIIDTLLVGAMSPPGGGRNFITPRMQRHFNVITFTEFSDETLSRIFKTITSWHFSKAGFDSSIKDLSSGIVKATLLAYTKAKECLLPTPLKSHYTFNLRDFSRVIQGVTMLSPSSASANNVDKSYVVRLWVHEMMRVFYDRLTDDQDRDWFVGYLRELPPKNFNTEFDDLFAHLKGPVDDAVTRNNLRKLFFGNFMVPGASPREYLEIRDANALKEMVDEYLVEYNSMSKQPMPLVLFLFAIEHISRISRVVSMPGGNALLVGVGGSGRQSLSRLASFMADQELIQIEISKNYNYTEWQEDMKRVIRTAGVGNREVCFLFSDTQIKIPKFVEDINNLLNSGEIPNLFPNDEKSECIESARIFAKQIYGKKAADLSPMEMWAFFVKRVRARLHVVLAFSPIGADFRDRLRKYPSLVNCCAIDWFTAWPTDALVAVARTFLADVKLETTEDLSESQLRQEIVMKCQLFHSSVEKLSIYYRDSLRRINYVTPTSYLELIQAYKTSLAKCRETVNTAMQRYLVGLEKLEFAESSVADMQKQLTDLQPVLEQSKKDTDALMVQIQEKLPGVEATKEVVGKEAAAAQKEADAVGAIKDECEADLAVAMPMLEDAIGALNTLKASDIGEVKNFKTPPAGVVLTMEAVCVMLNVKCAKAKDPNDPTKKIDDWWTPSKKILADPNFLQTLKDYDRDNINEKYMKKIRSKFMTNENFTPEMVKKASVAASGMCKWVRAMEGYDRVAKVVGPKKIALAEAEEKLGVTMGALQVQKDALKKVEDELGALEKAFEDATKKKQDLEDEVKLCGEKLIRAESLISGLGGEKSRWTQSAADLKKQYTFLTGDVLISSGVIAYLGPFTSALRDQQVSEWIEQAKAAGIPLSEGASLQSTLGDPVKQRQWIVDGLPSDAFSIDNGIAVFNSRRWPLMIDPQGQANKWIRNMEKEAGLLVIKLSDGNYLRTVENAIQFGKPVLLENVGETLDAALEPLLLKQLFKQGGVDCLRLGDSTVEYSPEFRFYITTKLPNPHYLPEVAVKVTLVLFMITPDGLEEQLLGITVEEERPDLAEEKARLIVEGAENVRKLKELEDNILHILSSSSGNILEDESAINALNSSKTLSNEIAIKQEAAEKTEKTIDEVRQGYRPVAYYGQVLYFCIADLASIEPVYQYSLLWFSNLFIRAIRSSEQSSVLEERMEILNNYFTYSLYLNICRSLLEKDKLIFSFLLTTKIMAGKNDLDATEWYFLLTGGVAMENPYENKTEWLAEKQWGEICRLSDLPAFDGLRDTFKEDESDWKRIYDASNAHEEKPPPRWQHLNDFQKMLLLRCVRPDKISASVQNFVIFKMGEKFVKPPQFDLKACYDDSNALSPLVFILSPGSDPMSGLLKFADAINQQVASISLGQGQGPIAERMIEKAQEEGSWVVLQNCHLAVSWMSSFERICEHITEENTKPEFRLWCTTYPSKDFPVSVLQNGVKMTNEPPKGLKANIIGSYLSDPISDIEFFEGGVQPDKTKSFHMMLYGLCIFHALVQERRQFGSLGWNIPYEFNDSDLKISIKQLAFFIDQFDEIPLYALRYCTGECNYGGRVTDDKDRRALHVILNRCYSKEICEAGFSLSPSGKYTVLDYEMNGSHAGFVEHIEKFPLVAEPEIFGMHDNATITKDRNETNMLFTAILLTEASNSSSGGEKTPQDIMGEVCADVLSKLQPDFNLEIAQVRYPVRWDESMNTVLQQELVRFNRLTSCIRPSLVNLEKAVMGTVVMSAELEKVGNSIYFGTIPELWLGKSYPSLKPCGSYIIDLYARLAMLDSWLMKEAPPIFWISGFYFTQAFLTGTMQNFARRNNVPIDSVAFDYEIMPEKQYSKGPESGAYVDGLFFDGARWDYETMEVADPLPKQLFSEGPVIFLVPMQETTIETRPHYNCPVYKTSERKGVLATTGHSSNFVMYLRLPSSKPQEFWIERGVALLTQLDD